MRQVLAAFVWLCLAQPCFAQASSSDATQSDHAPPSNSPAQSTSTTQSINELIRSAAKDCESGNWTEAEQKLNEALRAAPSSGAAHLDLAFVRLYQGDTEAALRETDIAAGLLPNTPEVLLQKGTILQTLGKTRDAITTFEDYLKRFPKDPRVPRYRALTSLLNKEAAAQDQIQSKLSPEERAADYFAFITRDGVRKWASEKMPLKVFIPPAEKVSNIQSYRPEYNDMVRRAFEEWQEASGGIVSFTFVDSPDGADIECVYTDRESDLVNKAEGGEAKLKGHYPNGIEHVQLLVLTVSPSGSLFKSPPPNLIHLIALHEIGHSLGMRGHSPQPGDILFPSVFASTQDHHLSERDVATLKHLYSSEVVQAPTREEKVVALNAEGIELAGKKDYKAAVLKFEQALALDANCKPARTNLAMCLYQQAREELVAKHVAQSRALLQRALKLETGPGADAKLRAQIVRAMKFVNVR